MGKKATSVLRTLLRNAVLLVNLAAIAWLILCYISSVTPPADIRYIALFSLTLPFALFINIVFVFFWLFSSRKFFSILSLSVLIFCWEMIPSVFGYHYLPANDWEKKDNNFKLMSWNVHAMGTFNNPHEKEHAKGVMEVILEEDADVLCLPEFAMNEDSTKRIYKKKIMQQGGYTDFRFNMDNGYGPKILIGTAIFSRYPIVRYEAHQLSRYIYLVEADLNIKGAIIRLGVVHLQSFGLSDEDKAIIEEVKQEQDRESLAKSKSFIWKFNEAYLRRAKEAEIARDIIRKSPYPVVICGDFNDLPFSYTYTTIKGPLTDAFAENGRGFGRTYNQIIPTLRIDHVFYSKDKLKVKAFETRYSAFSDHSPILANFEIIRDGN